MTEGKYTMGVALGVPGLVVSTKGNGSGKSGTKRGHWFKRWLRGRRGRE